MSFSTPTDIIQSEVQEGAKYQVPLIDPSKEDKKASLLLNVESGVKSLLDKISKNETVSGIDIDPKEFEKLPNSLTGVAMKLIMSGLKAELDIKFDAEPSSINRGQGSAKTSSGAKKLSRNKKNEILERMDMKYYLANLAAGLLTMEDITTKIKEAFDEKTEWENKGWKLPSAKTAYPEPPKAEMGV